MKRATLVLNAGSSSVKFAAAYNKRIILRGTIDRFGKHAAVKLQFNKRKLSQTVAIPDLRTALATIKKLLRELSFVPTRIGHRVVHGGQRFSKPTRLTPAVLDYLQELTDLAPLHQPSNLAGVTFASRMWPAATQWGFFDTAIYRGTPLAARSYALPQNLVKRFHIEKYGFHGTSHAWAFQQAARKLGIPLRKMSGVTLHLGSGCSMTLWENGRPIDTTMGFTPLEGLAMRTRSGDLDPAIPLFLQEQLGWSAQRVNDMLIHHSGLLGISGLDDMRDILAATGHPVPGWPRKKWSSVVRARSRLALEVFTYRIRKTLAGYLGLLNKPNTIIFTAPVGENRTIQKMTTRGLPAARSIRVLTVHADEEQAIVDQLSK